MTDIDLNAFNYIIIGAGFSGSTFARKMADAGHKVLILEKREHIAGNCYDYIDKDGILIHKYGPHLFHTASDRVFKYLSKFTDWIPYEHYVIGDIHGQKIPIPFNFDSIHQCFPQQQAKMLESKLIHEFGEGTKVPILKLREHEDQDFKELAQYVYDNVFLGYTMKQWGVRPEDLDASVTGRVPVLLSRDHRYFQDKHQYMPKEGYTKLFEKLLNHPNIKIKLNTDATSIRDTQNLLAKVVWTGPIDEYFHCKHGRLPYRTLKFKWENHKTQSFQEGPVVNYPVSEDYTRITEFKKLTGQKSKSTTIVKEFPDDYDPMDPERSIPYYSVHNPQTDQQVKKYREEAKSLPNVIFLGRLGEYCYYNMDGAVLRALVLAEKELKALT